MGNIYKKIENLCKVHEMKIGRLAAETGISRGTLTDLKMGRTKSLSLDTLSKIASYFNVPLDYFLIENDEQREMLKRGFPERLKILRSRRQMERKDIADLVHVDERIVELWESGIASPYLFKALVSNRHSLSSLNDYSVEILSSCFDIYNYNNITTITFRVQKEDDIDSIALSGFIYHTSKLLLESGQTSIAAKVNVHSAGDIILQIINGVQQHWASIIMICLLIGGGKGPGGIELPSILTTIRKIVQWQCDSKIKEEELREKKLGNDKREEELELLKVQTERAKFDLEQEVTKVQCHAEEIFNTSVELDIKPLANNIIPLDSWLKSETKE